MTLWAIVETGFYDYGADAHSIVQGTREEVRSYLVAVAETYANRHEACRLPRGTIEIKDDDSELSVAHVTSSVSGTRWEATPLQPLHAKDHSETIPCSVEQMDAELAKYRLNDR
jgi:hypothetical protein